MILINGIWEQVKSYEDCMRVIEENLGKEFSNKFRDITEVTDKAAVTTAKDELRALIGDLESVAWTLENIET
ncbi:hypothetical protein GKG47_14205 [Lactonifactor sp. BIOML-A3]|uniref:hypothetical protein n=1 Tax=unclassified Lactonifactor TaxID=2636670 RepID=UPI0012B00430|nr:MULTISPECIES: hypothetical protein [unclassified Lactonifactor]MSA02936.1 hypothetical protein [Lactonifactor sp. BIOML-A5]MSA10244.1 hypothetical protein [Lactonifactor sp. BIOML-A4]MSA13583.1 hypothetical protein [Lactonifactor sp. BIOML-A3]MSA19217.1 hypothetical protein [Lactonifactor sp. BIOML-A2]MSA39137.1 hypothetical protein [Lactonifactor sp. BIOML-A1]